MSIPSTTNMAESEPSLIEPNDHEECICINRLSGSSITIECMINNEPITAIVDTAADVTVLSEKVHNNMEMKLPIIKQVSMRAAGENMSFKAQKTDKVSIKLNNIETYRNIFIAPINDTMLLGFDILHELNAHIDVKLGEVTCKAPEKEGEIISPTNIRSILEEIEGGQIPVILQENVLLKENSETILPVYIPNQTLTSQCIYFEPAMGLPALVARSVHTNCVTINTCFVNNSNQPVKLSKGTNIGHLSPTQTEYHRISEKEVRQTNLEEVRGLPEYLAPMLEEAKKNISEQEAKQLEEMLIRNRDVFATGDYDLGAFTAIAHEIETGESPPITLPLRRTPVHFAQEEEEMLSKMLEAEIIQPSNSAWGAATVLIRKKCGKLRWCVDYRLLNNATKKDVFPMPNLSECIDALEGNIWMSKLDANSAYWQVPIHPNSKEKTAFRTKYGLFEFNKLAFGLCNSPSTYNRAMNLVLKGLNWKTALSFLDDICVIGRTTTEHLANLEEVFGRFREFQMKLKPLKCQLFQREVEFLGRKIGGNGVTLTDHSIETIKEWKEPMNNKEVEQFLGLANYHRNFIKEFAEVADPLNKLLRKKIFTWKEEQQKAFQKLKELLISPEVISIPNKNGEFILDCDASNVSIGAELSQVQQDMEKAIAYGSFSLTPSQRRYCTTRKELLALVRFSNHYRHYLLGKKFKCRTDHNSLIWLMNFKHLDGQLARWNEELSQFSMEIVHRPGKNHSNADALSRRPEKEEECQYYDENTILDKLPCGGCPYCRKIHEKWSEFGKNVDTAGKLSDEKTAIRQTRIECSPDYQMGIDILFTNAPIDIRTIDEPHQWLDNQEQIEKEQRNDPDLKFLINWLESGVEPNQAELNLADTNQKYYWFNRELFFIAHKIIYKKDEEKEKLLVPSELKKDIFHLCHNIPSAAHQGTTRTKEYTKRTYFWHQMSKDIKKFVNQCKQCNINKASNRKHKHPGMQSHMGIPMERVHLDFMGPFPTSKGGNKHILVMVDSFSKWCECIALESQSAELTAKTAVNEFFSRFGYPTQILTDQGRNFESELLKHICTLLKIQKKRTTAYRPQTNGQAERTNRTLLNAIRCFVDSRQDDWDLYLPQITAAIRSAVNRNTGFSANKLMLGREINTPAELMFPGAPKNQIPVEKFVESLEEAMLKAHDVARKTLKVELKRQKCHYDLNQRSTSFKQGDAIYLLDKTTKTGRAKKLEPIWQGPAVITQLITPFLFRIRLKNRTERVVNHDAIKKCSDAELPTWVTKVQQQLEKSLQEVYCFCRKPDDGLLMVQCQGCLEWFHGSCIGMTRNQAMKMGEYVCKGCPQA